MAFLAGLDAINVNSLQGAYLIFADIESGYGSAGVHGSLAAHRILEVVMEPALSRLQAAAEL